MAWTDERLDDLARRMDAGFEQTHADIRALRTELRGDMDSLRSELRSEFRAEIGELRMAMTRFGIAMVIALVGVLAAVAVGG